MPLGNRLGTRNWGRFPSIIDTSLNRGDPDPCGNAGRRSSSGRPEARLRHGRGTRVRRVSRFGCVMPHQWIRALLLNDRYKGEAMKPHFSVLLSVALVGFLAAAAFAADSPLKDWCVGPGRMCLASVGCGEACGNGFEGLFEPRVGAGRVLERQLGALGNADGGIGAYGGRGVSQVAPTQQRQATRRSSTTGRCLRPCSNVTTSSRRAPGWPLTSVWGIAQGEPRGQRGLVSKRGERLAGRRPK
jgi:hypothetical protein